jgi:hypothetical protein
MIEENDFQLPILEDLLDIEKLALLFFSFAEEKWSFLSITK